MSTQPNVDSTPAQLFDSRAAAENAFSDSGTSPPSSQGRRRMKNSRSTCL